MKLKIRDWSGFIDKEIEDKDFVINDDLKAVIKVLGIESDVDKIISRIDFAKPVKLSRKSYAPKTQSYELKTPYGTYSFWKNDSEDFYRISHSKIDGDNYFLDYEVNPETFEQAERYLKNILKESAILNLIYSLIYTGVEYGIGNKEYTNLGYRKKDILKKHGFNGIY